MTAYDNKHNMIQLIMDAMNTNDGVSVNDHLKPIQKRLSQAVFEETDALNRLTAVRHAIETGDEAVATALAEEWLDSIQAFSDLTSDLNPLEALNSCLHQHQRQLQIVETNAHIRQVTAVVKEVIRDKKKDPKITSKEPPAHPSLAEVDAQDLLEQFRSKD